MAFQSNIHVTQPALVSPSSVRDTTSSRVLASLSSMNHSSSNIISSYYLDDILRMEEAAAASRMVTQMALAQIRIAREQQSLNFRRYPVLFDSSMMNPRLDILGTAAMIQQKPLLQNYSSDMPHGLVRSHSTSSVIDSTSMGSNDISDNSGNDENDESNIKTYVESIDGNDVLCGRGGRSNHHVGNKRYRLVVAKMKYMYQKCSAKTMKTDLSRAIVKHCTSYGARFLKLDESNGKYYILSRTEARKKTSQALRESKALKWIN